MEMESSPRRGLTDAAAAERIRREFGTLTPAAAAISPKQLTASLNTLTAEGISVRQLSRLTGLSRSTIANRLKSQDPGNQGDGSLAL